MIVVKHRGNFKRTEKYLSRLSKFEVKRILDKYGQEGVAALAAATPVETGLTASSWSYEVSISGSAYTITWSNSHVNKGVPIAIILQYGHGTGTGGYVQGRDYINPAMRPIFDRIAEEAWKEVTTI
jgi:hypothetical protein